MKRSDFFRRTKRIVVKIGSSSITESGTISSLKISKFASDIAELKKMGYEVAVVTSGAISSGAGVLKLSRNNLTIPEKQAFAAVGQAVLMNEYRKCFEKLGYNIGQILLTEDDMRSRKRFLNARNAMDSLFKLNVIPVINENDTVTVSEIKFGDNDTLSAHVFNLIEADLLILLSDIDGFYHELTDPEPVYEIFKITDDIRRRAGGAGTSHGTGGMYTKVNAAEMIMRFGGMMIVADGREPGILSKIMSGERKGTLFAGEIIKINERKKWISMRKTRGSVRIDDGAVTALLNGKKSLLATGIIDIQGKFDMGDIIDITDKDKKIIAKGIVNYKSEEMFIIKGKKTAEIKSLLNGQFFDEVINRDDMIIL
ncbi:MAG: glutamate 5-kinase [Spirochaetae bacterium HGW-Spirochaetae-5]|nr:MAG: glutamate 5-kinase [Spirochaetae bacterium HGW-Spirochaetae-5]